MVISCGSHGSIGLAPTEKTGGAASMKCGTSTDIDNRIYEGFDNVCHSLESNFRAYTHLVPGNQFSYETSGQEPDRLRRLNKT